MRRLSIYLADLTYTTLSLATEAFPLNIGFVAAFCKKQFGDQVDLKLFKYLDDLDEAIRTNPPDILGMSNYPWNYNVGLQFFRFARSISPKTICVMGGPNIPLDDQMRTSFILKNPLIDFYTYLEGETAFANIVERTLAVGLDKTKLQTSPIEGVIFRVSDSEVVKGQMLNRKVELDDIPSPYLGGFMDKFFDGKLTPLLETNRGCPFSCTYCHEGNYLISKVNFFSVDRVKEELDYCAKKVPEQVTNLMFADPNFGMYERDFEICSHIAAIQARQNWPRSIFASTGKNKKERIAQSLRVLNGTMKLWMSVQSMDPEVLKEIKRSNIKLSEMMGLAQVFEEMGLPTYSEIILALPGETFESHIQSISKVVEAGIDLISTYTLMLLNGTEMSTPEYRTKYGIKSHFRVLPRDFGKFSDGSIAVEIEEVVTSTNTMSFEEYQKARRFHLIVNSVYNGKGFGPLFKFFKEAKVPVFKLLQALVENIDQAPVAVKELFEGFTRKTREELWDTEEALREYILKDQNYDKLLSGELGANLIQTHNAKSMRIMDSWAEYIFTTAQDILSKENLSSAQLEMLDDIKSYCIGRVHNLWGENHGIDNPIFNLHYDVKSWMVQKVLPLSDFRWGGPKSLRFEIPHDKQVEMEKYLSRFGNTDTGIGRILTKINITSIWREGQALI